MNEHNLQARFNEINEFWSPKIIGEVNDQYIKIAKLQGEFVWHDHKEEDELFYIIKGSLIIHLMNEKTHLEQGDFYVVPRGVQHKPEAPGECWVMLIENKSTRHTGEVQTRWTKSIEDQLN